MANENTPALRFDGFKGEWNEVEVQQIADVVGGGTPSTSVSSFWGGNIDWYSPNEIGDSAVAKPSQRRITPAGLANSSARFLPAYKTVLFTSRASIGYSAILDHPATTNQGFQSLVLRDGVDTYFAYSLTPRITETAITLATGSTFLEVSNQTVRAIQVHVPTLEEQRSIGELFTHLDALIEQRRAKHHTLQQAKTALMQRIFPRDGASEPELRIGGHSGEWALQQIAELAVIGNGRDYKHLDEGNIPVYGTGGYMLSVNNALSWDADAIGIGRKGTIDKPYLLRAPFWTVDTLFYVITREGVDLPFLYSTFQRVDWKAKNTATGVPSLTSQAIGQTEVAVPPTLEEQRAIGATFANLDKLIATEAAYVTQLSQAKTALMKRMFV